MKIEEDGNRGRWKEIKKSEKKWRNYKKKLAKFAPGCIMEIVLKSSFLLNNVLVLRQLVFYKFALYYLKKAVS